MLTCVIRTCFFIFPLPELIMNSDSEITVKITQGIRLYLRQLSEILYNFLEKLMLTLADVVIT